MEECRIRSEEVRQARAYADRTLEQLAGGRTGLVPAWSELFLSMLATGVAKALLDQAAQASRVGISSEVDAAGWPPVLVLDEGDQGEPAFLCAIVGESSMEPRPVWPLLVREELVGEVLYHAYLSVWIPAHEKFDDPEPADGWTGRLAGWLDAHTARGLPVTSVAPHIGNEVGGAFRAGKVSQLQPLDELLAIAAGQRLTLRG